MIKFQRSLGGEGKAHKNEIRRFLRRHCGGDVRLGLGRAGAAHDLPSTLGHGFRDRFRNGGVLVNDQDFDGIGGDAGFLGCWGGGCRRRCRSGCGFWIQRDEARDAVDHIGLGKWLHDVIPNAHLGDFEHVFLARLGGEHDHGNVLERGIRLELSKALHAIHHRHGDVEKNDIRFFPGRDLQALGSVAGEHHLDIVWSKAFVDKCVDHSTVVDTENFR